MRRIALVMLSFFIMVSIAHGDEDPVTRLAADTASYFKPMSGEVMQVEGNKVTIKVDGKDSVKAGMRAKILREGAPFYHPVTGELLGRIESTVGKIEIKDVVDATAKGLIVEGEAQQGDKVRISDTRVRLFFCQSKGMDWYLGDDYYNKLKASGRLEMIDTALESTDEAKVLGEARKQGAEVALILTAEKTEKNTVLHERLFWVSDGEQFIDSETLLPAAYSDEMKVGQAFFSPRAAEEILKFDLPLGEELVTMADIEGKGEKEIVLASSRTIRVYKYAVDLLLLWEIKGSMSDDYIWLDSADLNNDGKDEIIVTSMKGGGVVSYIYSFTGSGFKKIWEGKYFLRRSGKGLIAQAYSGSDGFAGGVYHVTWNGSFGLGEEVKLPKGVNIYDFAFVRGTGKERMLVAYDDKGFLSLYDATGAKVWRSGTSAGSFKNTYKKQAGSMFSNAGEWSVKDKLVTQGSGVLAVQRVPLVEMAKGLGIKSSRLRQYWWNGFSMEENMMIDGIDGSLLDYSLTGDKIAVLTRPFMGIKFGNILKGENPVGTELDIYVVKGR